MVVDSLLSGRYSTLDVFFYNRKLIAIQSNLGLTDKCGPTTVRCWKKSVNRKRSVPHSVTMFVIITALKLNEQNKLNKLTDTSCDVTMQVNGESLCLCDNVARFLVSSAIDFRL